MRLAVVLWNGNLGGAESFSVGLSRALRQEGVDVRVLFVCYSAPLADRLARGGIPWESLNLPRGRHVAFHPRLFARSTALLEADAALLVSPGFLPGALRAGRYRGAIVSVNHDTIVQRLPPAERVVRFVDRLSGFWASNAEVAVSDFLLERLRAQPHARRLVRIHNGVDMKSFHPGFLEEGTAFTVGWAGRLVPGKGVGELLHAFAALPGAPRLRIAGDGPERKTLEGRARSLGIASSVSFEGWVPSMPEFWRGCHVAAMPSNELAESFGMAAAEAMASGLPVVATRRGALPELVDDGSWGFLVPPGDSASLGTALRRYLENPGLRHEHGLRARGACEKRFDLKRCAASYLDLIDSILRGRKT